jgi:type I restriction enzyme, S subunit
MSSMASTPIPKNWSWKTVGEFTTEHKQGYYTKESYTPIGTYLIRITDLGNPAIDYSEMPRLNIDEKEFQQFKVSVGDFLFARSGAIGRYGIVIENYPAVFASYLIRFRFDDAQIFTRYFGYLYESDLCQKQLASITQGSSNININAENIKSLLIPFAPVPEQQKIASILTAVDDVIESTQAQINKLKDLKTGMMQELLTKGIGHTEFKDSPVGRIPKAWGFSTIGELAEQVKPGPFGSAITKSMYVESGFKVYGQEQVIAGDLKVGDYYITKEKYEELSAFQVGEGEILISLVGTFGQVLVIPSEFEAGIINPRLLKLRMPKESVDPYFVAQQLKSEFVVDQLNRFQQGGTMGVLSGSTLRPVKLVVPPLKEQREISMLLSNFEKNIQIKELKKEKLIDFKKALMQDLLTGKVRVKVN